MALGFQNFTTSEALSKAFRENSDKQSGQISVILKDELGNVIFSDAELNFTQVMENDGEGKVIFIGLAVPGSAKSAASWQIRKITYDGIGAATNIQFANSSTAFNQIWDNRSGLAYS